MGLLLEFVRRRRFGSDDPFNSTGNFTQSSASAPVTRMVHDDQTGPASGPPEGFVDTPGGVVHDLTPHQGAGGVTRGSPAARTNSAAAPRSPVQSVNTTITPEGRALLDTIAGTESPGYNVLYGGRRFNDLSQHPGVAVPIQRGPNAGKTSSAAGRYQFLLPTWNGVSKELGLKDFSPESQDKGAWHLAQKTYGQKTGRDLQTDLANGKHDLVGQALHGQWTSLPGGIEQSKNYNSQKFTQNFNQNLGRYNNPNTQVAGNNPTPNTPQPQTAANDNRGQSQAQPPQTGSPPLSMSPDLRPQQMAANTPVQNAPPPPSVPPSTNPTSNQTSPSPQQAAPTPQAANDDEQERRLAASASPRVRIGHHALSEINTVRGKNMPKLRSFFIEGDPIQAGLQVDFEEREADPLQYGMPTHNIHPASEIEPGADDGMGAPYDGAPIPGQEGQGLPPGGAMPMPDEQMQPITPQAGGQQQPPPRMESMDQFDFDLLLDHILDEAPGDNSAASLNRQELGMVNRYGAQNFAPSMFRAPTPQMQQGWNGAPARPGMMGQAAPASRAPMRGGHGPANPPAGAVAPAGAGQPDVAQNGQVARTGAADRVNARYTSPAMNGQASPAGSADRVGDRYAATPGPSQRGAAPMDSRANRQVGQGTRDMLASRDTAAPAGAPAAPAGAPATSQAGYNPLGFMNRQSSFSKTGNAPDAQASVSGGSLNNPSWFKQTGNAPNAQAAVSGGSAPSPSLAAPAAPGAPNLGVGGAMKTASLKDSMDWSDYNMLYESDRAAEKKVRGY